MIQAQKARKKAKKDKAKAKAKRLKLRQSPKRLKAEADRLFSLIIRARGHCESGRPNHAGPLQCAHGFSRRYLSTRWDYLTPNAWALCAGCHLYFTRRPEEWQVWMEDRLGVSYRPLRSVALDSALVAPIGDTLERLRAEVQARAL